MFHFQFDYHFSYKFSTFHFMFDGAFKVCSEEFVNGELDNIRIIGGPKCYKISYINKLINSYRKGKSKQKGQTLNEDYNKDGG